MHVRVHGNHEPGPWYVCPSTRVYFVGSDHPAQEQVPALRRASPPYLCEKQPVDAPGVARELLRQAVECGEHRGIRAGEMPEEGVFETAVSSTRLSDRIEEMRDFLAPEEPVDESVEALAKLREGALLERGGRPLPGGRPGVQPGEHVGTHVENTAHTPEREGGADKGNYLAIGRMGVAPHDFEGIGVDVPWRMVTAVGLEDHALRSPRRRGTGGAGGRATHLHPTPAEVCSTDMQALVAFVAENFFWVFIAILLVNVLQRRHQATAEKKRFATLYLGIAAFFFYTSAQALVMYELSPYYFVPVAALIVGVVYHYREHTFPFRLHCARSGKLLNLETILFRDSNILPESENGEPPADEDDAP